MHLRAEQVLLNGEASRYCQARTGRFRSADACRVLTTAARVFPQKCSRFHTLPAFSGSNRTCTMQLDKQIALRRARRGAEPPSSAGSPPTASASPPLTPAVAAVAAEPFVGAGGLSYDASLFAFVDQTLLNASWLLPDAPAAPAAPPDRARALAAWGGSELPSLRSVSLKLDAANPGMLPPSLAPALAAAWCDDAALCLEAAPRPGCTLLHVDALLPAHAWPAPGASRLLSNLLAGSAGAWLRKRAVILRTCGGDAAAAEPGGAPVALPATELPHLPQLLPLALHSAAPATLRASGWARPPPGCALWLRLHGQVCTLRCEGGVITLPPLHGAEGAARLWLAQDGAAGGAERTVLLTRDAAVAAETATLEAAANDAEAAERLLYVLGAALRPGCSPRALAAAAAEALSRGWEATCARLLPQLRAALDAGACDAEARAAARTLLHAAALSGRPSLAQLTLSLSADGALGTPHGQDSKRGVTPMHLAAMAGDGATAEVLASHSPAALVAWFHVRSLDGVTAADAARAAGGASARTHAALSRRLNGALALASELAALASNDAPQSEAAQQLQPIDDAALARFLLHAFAPADPAAPTAVGERQLYEAQRLASRRVHALCFPPFAIAAMLRRVLITGPPSAAIAAISPHVEPTFHQAWAAYQNVEQQSRMMVVLFINVAMLTLAGLPQLRGVYERHGVAALRTFAILQFLVLPALAEVRVQSTLGFAVKWPVVEGMIFTASMTTHMALLPLPCRDSVALLAARWSQMLLARMTGIPIWQGSAATVGTTVVASAVHASLAVLVVLMDRRAWAAWRLSRLTRLAERVPRKQA